MPELIYLDTCVLNRPSDDPSQPRIRQEAQALGRMLDIVYAGRVHWFTSTIVRFEIEQNPDPLRRVRALSLLSSASRTLTPQPASIAETAKLVACGLSPLDALHLALAHEAAVDWLITTDDRFVRKVAREIPGYSPAVINPVDWLQRRQAWLLQP